jgi:hypothetical protein
MTAMIFGGFIGNLVGGFGGMIIGALALGVIAVVATMPGKNHSSKAPPKVRLDPPATSAVDRQNDDDGAAERLARLKALKDQGVLTNDEYAAQRATIISTL